MFPTHFATSGSYLCRFALRVTRIVSRICVFRSVPARVGAGATWSESPREGKSTRGSLVERETFIRGGPIARQDHVGDGSSPMKWCSEAYM